MVKRRKNIIIRFFTSQIFISLALLALLVIIVLPLVRDYRQRYNVDKEVAGLKEEIAEAESQNSEFRKMIEYLESDQFVEEQARINLGLKKPGEEVIIVQGQPDEPEKEEVMKEEPLINDQAMMLLNNFKKWVSYFFKTEMSQEWDSNP
ncbi:MAG: septum formation initiator family protein [bacterium]